MIYSGLDWSGSPGREPHDPLLVLAIVHFESEILPDLERELGAIRTNLRLPPNFVFKHLGASTPTQQRLFAALGRLPMRAHVLIVDKSTWTDEYVRRSRGPDRVFDAVIALVLGCPEALVARQRLFVDLERRDMRMVRDLRTAIRQALSGAGRKSFANVQPCPDHRQHGSIVQIADLIAGEVHEQGGLGGPYLPALGAKLRIV